jgi:hypothetical protein
MGESSSLMVDCETLSVRSNAAILSIGAVRFDPDGDEPADPAGLYMGGSFNLNGLFYVNVELKSCLGAGLVVDASTIEFWMGEELNEARAYVLSGERFFLNDALHMLAEFSHGCTRVWSNGADFDLPILYNAFRAVGFKIPWPYNAARDTRTLWDVCGEGSFERVHAGVKHHALHDAWAQAVNVQRCWKTIKKNLRTTGPVAS